MWSCFPGRERLISEIGHPIRPGQFSIIPAMAWFHDLHNLPHTSDVIAPFDRRCQASTRLFFIVHVHTTTDIIYKSRFRADKSPLTLLHPCTSRFLFSTWHCKLFAVNVQPNINCIITNTPIQPMRAIVIVPVLVCFTWVGIDRRKKQGTKKNLQKHWWLASYAVKITIYLIGPAQPGCKAVMYMQR